MTKRVAIRYALFAGQACFFRILKIGLYYVNMIDLILQSPVLYLNCLSTNPILLEQGLKLPARVCKADDVIESQMRRDVEQYVERKPFQLKGHEFGG
jgi:hypothetical protein